MITFQWFDVGPESLLRLLLTILIIWWYKIIYIFPMGCLSSFCIECFKVTHLSWMLLEPESLAFWYNLFLVLICFLSFAITHSKLQCLFAVLRGIYVYTRFCIWSWNCCQRWLTSTFSLDILQTQGSSNYKPSAIDYQSVYCIIGFFCLFEK